MAKEIKLNQVQHHSWINQVIVKGIYDGEVLIKNYNSSATKTIDELFPANGHSIENFAKEFPAEVLARIKEIDKAVSDLQNEKQALYKAQYLTKEEFIALFVEGGETNG